MRGNELLQLDQRSMRSILPAGAAGAHVHRAWAAHLLPRPQLAAACSAAVLRPARTCFFALWLSPPPRRACLRTAQHVHACITKGQLRFGLQEVWAVGALIRRRRRAHTRHSGGVSLRRDNLQGSIRRQRTRRESGGSLYHAPQHAGTACTSVSSCSHTRKQCVRPLMQHEEPPPTEPRQTLQSGTMTRTDSPP